MPSPRYAITVPEAIPIDDRRTVIASHQIDLTDGIETLGRILAGEADPRIIEGTCHPATAEYLASLRGTTIKVEGEWGNPATDFAALLLAAPGEE